MYNAKDILVKPISSQSASEIIKKLHYSGKIVQNSQLHFGCFIGDKCGGALQYGPSLDKRKIQGLVKNTGWNGFIELNRMAFADWLPRNSESRAIAYTIRFIKNTYPHIKWIISFADATQCGDGTIYRASGFVLTGIKKNSDLFLMPDGRITHSISEKTGKNKLSFYNSTGGGVLKNHQDLSCVVSSSAIYILLINPILTILMFR